MAINQPRKNSDRSLSLAVQSVELRSKFPESKIALTKGTKLIWIGKLHPSHLSIVYTVQIIYQFGKRPEVRVLDPVLKTRPGEKIPHMFRGKDLCLYRSKYGEWVPSKLIASTIIPWTSLWLLHYEIWLASGEWCGSRAEHP